MFYRTITKYCHVLGNWEKSESDSRSPFGRSMVTAEEVKSQDKPKYESESQRGLAANT